MKSLLLAGLFCTLAAFGPPPRGRGEPDSTAASAADESQDGGAEVARLVKQLDDAKQRIDAPRRLEQLENARAVAQRGATRAATPRPST